MAKIRVLALLSVVPLTFCAAPLISRAPIGRASAAAELQPSDGRDRRRGRRSARPRGLSLDVRVFGDLGGRRRQGRRI